MSADIESCRAVTKRLVRSWYPETKRSSNMTRNPFDDPKLIAYKDTPEADPWASSQ